MRKQGSVYWHVGNSGVTFEVVDQGQGPTLVVKSGAFGNLKNTFEVHTDEFSLRMLGLMFLDAANHRFSEEYVHAALREHRPPRKRYDEPVGSFTSSDENMPKRESAPQTFEERLPFYRSRTEADQNIMVEQAAFAVLTASAVFAKTPLVPAAHSFEMFPSLDWRQLLWLWRQGFLEQAEEAEMLKWNPKGTFSTDAATKRPPTYQEELHEAARIAKKMAFEQPGPKPWEMSNTLPLLPIPVTGIERPQPTEPPQEDAPLRRTLGMPTVVPSKKRSPRSSQRLR